VKVFAVDLISQLSVQYTLPKSLSTARLAVNAISTLLSVLASQAREELILTVLPPLTRYVIPRNAIAQ
jgi:integrator complex subunit 2